MGKRCLIHDLFIYLLPLILQTILPHAIAHLTWNRFVFYRATRNSLFELTIFHQQVANSMTCDTDSK